jgi:hypothetical protein
MSRSPWWQVHAPDHALFTSDPTPNAVAGLPLRPSSRTISRPPARRGQRPHEGPACPRQSRKLGAEKDRRGALQTSRTSVFRYCTLCRYIEGLAAISYSRWRRQRPEVGTFRGPCASSAVVGHAGAGYGLSFFRLMPRKPSFARRRSAPVTAASGCPSNRPEGT